VTKRMEETALKLAELLNDARETNRRLHRRVQEAESKAATAWRQNDMTRLWKTVDELRLRTAYYREGRLTWKYRYRFVADLLPRFLVTWAVRRADDERWRRSAKATETKEK
jgi:hypothetical protein